ncbi:MAG: alpha/beta hydrolase [Synechococcales cyanobacterium CRU_2_2]|nr:alpha/beta hydrolase [Synechococcales cyanobacterium CRU_2_2]
MIDVRAVRSLRLLALVVALVMPPMLGKAIAQTPVAATESAEFQHPGSTRRLILTYGTLQVPLSLEALETFSRSGQLMPALSPYLAALDPQLQHQFRQQLRFRLGLERSQLAQFLSSPMGELLLSVPEDLLHGSQPGLLRQVVLQAAATPEGLTLLNVIRHLPQDTRVDLKQAMQLWQEQQAIAQATRQQLEQIDRQIEQQIEQSVHRPVGQLNNQPSSAIATPPAPFPSDSRDLRQPGESRFEKQTLQLDDAKRDRRFQADLYLPTQAQAQTQIASQPQTPLIILSHGLGADRQSQSFFARHLASHGIAAAVVQHPGSDSHQLQAMLQGKTQDVLDVSAFVERPRDVSYLLDALERRNDLQRRLRLNRVGVYGHSLGAYTALALAGAKINFGQLKQDCQPRQYAFDLSLILQCRARDLPQRDYHLQDSRVVALLLFDPVSRSILGQQGLGAVRVPVLWGGSDADVLTPLLTEQLPAFSHLGSAEKYLGIIEAVQHVNLKLDRLTTTQNWAETKLIDAKPEAFQNYVNALGLAFTQVYVAERSEYRPYLSASYGRWLSQSPHRLRFLPQAHL